MAKGSCNCGAVSYEILTDVSDVYVCHCSICRRATGSNGIAVVVVNNPDFRWTGGEEHIATWRKPDGDWQTWWLITSGWSPGRCGTRSATPAGSIRRRFRPD